jgi:adenosylcobyric acid synthase
MVQGTGSSVGKSVMVSALCRIFLQDGYSVAPFKAQNMSLNSSVTPDGAEIGRAQTVQAEAAGVLPTVDMNPVLLKPEVAYRSQLVVMGKPAGSLESRDFMRRKDRLWDVVAGALDRLRNEYDVVVVEGAGSPAEINLRKGDIVNMEVALHADAPVLLLGDIDKGGVFASLYGTVLLLSSEERALVKGTVINKFRGDVSVLQPGLRELERLTKVPVLGVVPYFRDIDIPEEDSPSGESMELSAFAVVDVAVLALPHIANFDDFDPLKRDAGVGLRYVRSLDQLGDPDLVIVPGSKTTVADLRHLRATGIADRLIELADSGTCVIGICGGYQMLGELILDPDGVESDVERTRGLGLLPEVTRFTPEKQTHRVSGYVSEGRGLLKGVTDVSFDGYEIHMGVSAVENSPGEYRATSPFRLVRRSGLEVDAPDGSLAGDGWVMGTYVHGLFHNTELRRGIVSQVAAKKGAALEFADDAFSQSEQYEKLADLVRRHLNMEDLRRIVGL